MNIQKLLSSVHIGQYIEEDSGKIFEVYRNIFDDGMITYFMSHSDTSSFDTRMLDHCPKLIKNDEYDTIPEEQITNQVDHNVNIAIQVLKRYKDRVLESDLCNDLDRAIERAWNKLLLDYIK